MLNYQSALNDIHDEFSRAQQTDAGLPHSSVVKIVDKLSYLKATAIQMDDLFSVLRRQGVSLRATGLADWASFNANQQEKEESKPEPSAAKKEILSSKANKPKKIDFPKFEYPNYDQPTNKIRVGTILDTFSESAFSYEWINVPLGKETWKSQIDTCELVFVESAWAGNNNEWRYCLTGTSAPRPEVIELVRYAKQQGIPTVFWNKEDPPHFADFLRTAALFDVVLTTDESCVMNYKKVLGHDNVGVLPFAAQPKIHNPIRPGKVFRNKQVAFGGMYFAHKYPERREQMEYLLPAAAKFDFDIFSRQLGGDEKYQFPEPFDKNVVGSLPYDSMLTAYHAYSVFLNVNSVTTSSTMCARRIFEIIASGGSVVSAPSPAIESFFPEGLVPMPRNEAEAYSEIRALLQPGGYRDKLVHKAQRIIWNEHTFAHRVHEILKWSGIKTQPSRKTVSVIAPTIRPNYVEHVLDSVARQENIDLELNLLLHGFELDIAELKAKARDRGIQNINVLLAPKDSSLGSNLNRLVAASSGDIVSKMDDDDFYGAHYLEDLVNAKMYSGADIVGKASSYIHFESKNATILSYGASENRFTNFVRGATLTADRDLFLAVPFQDLHRSEDSTFIREVIGTGGSVYAADRFNFWVRRSANKDHHTWSVEDRELFASGPVVSYGDPSEFVGA